jgi:hypothetical protein
LPCLLAAAGVLGVGLAACGDDDDDDRLTQEEYFAQVDTLNGDVDASAEEAFTAETADEGIESLTAAVDTFEEGLRDLSPPEDLEDLHDEYVAAVDEFTDFLEDASEDLEEGAPIDELQNVLFADGNDPFVEIERVECELVGIADEAGITLEFLSCPGEAEGPEAAGDNAVDVEAVEFQFNLDGEFSADTTGFVLANAGEQPHEASLSRIPEDLDIEAALQSEEEPEGVEEVGGTFAEPGEEAGFGFEEPLEPGRYVLLCFVPDEETGQPHALLGMVAEFTIE